MSSKTSFSLAERGKRRAGGRAVAVVILGSFLAALGLLIPTDSLSQECEPGSERLFENAIREELETNGLEIESILTLDLMSNLHGGLRERTAFLGDYTLGARLDTEKAGLWSGGTFYTVMLWTFGDPLSADVGDLQFTDNIEAPNNLSVYELWYEQALIPEKLFALVGIHDLNTDFDLLQFGSALINSSFGISPEIGQTNPSIFPVTGFGGRVKVTPAGSFYSLLGAYDGSPGSSTTTRGTHLDLSAHGGVLTIGEIGIDSSIAKEAGRYHKVALGGWFNTARETDFAGAVHDLNYGGYLDGEVMLLPESADSAQGLGAFLQLGAAPQDRNRTAQYVGAGLSYTGLISGRDKDVAATGLALARNSRHYMDTALTDKRAETALEVTYIAQVLSFLSLQPDIQWVINPGTDPQVDHAFVVGIRLKMAM